MKHGRGHLFIVVFFFLLSFLFFPPKIFAGSPQIISYPTEMISLDTPFTITATMSGVTKNAIYRLRIALAPSGTSDYFGSTYDGTSWHSGSITAGNFTSITIDGNGIWYGEVKGKIDPEDPSFTTGSGTYDLKIGRYTQTGSTATWSEPVLVILAVPPTPIPTNTPAPTATQAPTPTPTKTPTSVPTATKIPTMVPIKTPTPKVALLLTGTLGEQAVLAASEEAESDTPTPVLVKKNTPAPTNDITEKESLVKGIAVNYVPHIMITFGLIMVISCAILLFLQQRKNSY